MCVVLSCWLSGVYLFTCLGVTELPVSILEAHFVFVHSACLYGTSTYDHRSVRTGHPVRSAIHKH
jgi:hypothetical protein